MIVIPMYIDIVPNRKSPPAILLRESYRENGQVKKRTLANLSKLPRNTIECLRQALLGQALVVKERCPALFMGSYLCSMNWPATAGFIAPWGTHAGRGLPCSWYWLG